MSSSIENIAFLAQCVIQMKCHRKSLADPSKNKKKNEQRSEQQSLVLRCYDSKLQCFRVLP